MSSYYRFIFYILPFCYLIKSRLQKFNLFLSWFFIFYFINFLTVYLMNQNINFLYYNLFFFILIYNYEIGYFINDFITSKNEQNPTIRLNNTEYEFVDNNFNKIIFLRIFILLLLFIFFFRFINLYFILCILFMNFAFILHNYFRGFQNIFTFLFLHHSKNLCITMPFIHDIFLLNFIIFCNSSLYRFLENLSLSRFKLTFFNKSIISTNRHMFRFIYFIFIFFIITIFLFYTNNMIIIIPTLLILIFRSIIFYLYKNE